MSIARLDHNRKLISYMCSNTGYLGVDPDQSQLKDVFNYSERDGF